ncbi:MAG: hypothetical protein QXE62_06945 [Candidatus Nitrosocaldaceae archaeon]
MNIENKGLIVFGVHVSLIALVLILWIFFDGDKLREIVFFVLGMYPLILYKLLGIRTKARPTNKNNEQANK